MRSLILPILLILSIFACQKPANTSYLADEYANPKIELVTLRDTLTAQTLSNLSIQEVKGVKATYVTGKSTAYFEYIANHHELLMLMNTLPFNINAPLSDTVCRKMSKEFSLRGKLILSDQEIESSAFFWNINPEDFTYYECIKSPMRHTILFDKHSNRILHRIEFES